MKGNSSEVLPILLLNTYLLCCAEGEEVCRVAKPDPDLLGRSRIRKIFTGSYRYFGYVKLYTQGKNILKIESLHIFRSIFPFFQEKKNHHSNIGRNLIDVKKLLMFE